MSKIEIVTAIMAAPFTGDHRVQPYHFRYIMSQVLVNSGFDQIAV